MRKAQIEKCFNLQLEAQKKLFQHSAAPKLRIETSRLGGTYIVSLESILLRDEIGSIDIKLEYDSSSDDYVLKKYCFKFFSLHDVVTVLDKKTNTNKNSRYGFRFDSDPSNSRWGHPAQHLQFEFLNRPRFDNHLHITSDSEVIAFSEFLKTIRETYCEETTDKTLSHSLLALR